jgi:tol-pal system protein YbgF
MILHTFSTNRARLAALLLAAATLPVWAAPTGLTQEQRLQRLEKILQNQSLSNMVLQIQSLQQEVQRLRGELEEQNHALESLSKRQRDLYLDLDRRLNNGAAGASATPASGTAPESKPPPPISGAPATPRAAATPAAPATPAPPAAASGPGEAPAAGSAAVAPGDPAKEQAAYQQAFDLLKRGNYPESIAAFRKFLAAYPAGSYADNAQYWLGEASYVTRDFDTAMADFTKVVSQFPNSAKVPGALLKIGFIQYEEHDWAKARTTLRGLMAQYPRSTEARLADQRLELMRRQGH